MIKSYTTAFALATLAATAAATSHLTDAEVRKVDREQGKLTLKHAEIRSLDMPPMTMVFAVKDKAMLDKLQPGAKVRFAAVKEGGVYTVTELEAAK